MSLSYSALNNYGKVTLPSTDNWGSNMNILRDPPKSIYTRKIDKVGQTSSITEMIDESGNRACEAINLFPRGVNPFVAVSYDNFSNNAGRSGIIGNNKQAYLPYTVNKDGAFRPPVLKQENLLPLSRMPRVWTTAFSNPGFADFSKKMMIPQPAELTKEVHNNILHSSVTPNAVYKLEKPIDNPAFNVKYTIQNPNKVSAISGFRTLDYSQHTNLDPSSSYIDNNNLHSFAQTNINDNLKFVNNNIIDTTRYVQDINTSNVVSNCSSKTMQSTPIDELYDLDGDVEKTKNKEVLHTNYQTTVSGPEQTKYFHEDLVLEKILPNYQMSTNVSDNKYVRNEYEKVPEFDRNTPLTNYQTNLGGYQGATVFSDTNSRDYKLIPKIQSGEYTIPANSIPQQNKINNINENYRSDRNDLSHRVMNIFTDRYA